jgi:hypothetical protein
MNLATGNALSTTAVILFWACAALEVIIEAEVGL